MVAATVPKSQEEGLRGVWRSTGGRWSAAAGKKGFCRRRIPCNFRHDGIPVEDGRCYVCGE
eukprot:1732492-Prorocentrum_lima.AAC.1